MREFAKLYDTEHGQILVMAQSSDDTGAPEIRFFCVPHPDLGVSSVAITWRKDDYVSWDAMEAHFDGMTKERAVMAIQPLVRLVDSDDKPKAGG